MLSFVTIFLSIILQHCDAQNATTPDTTNDTTSPDTTSEEYESVAVARMFATSFNPSGPLPTRPDFSLITLEQSNGSHMKITWNLAGFTPKSNASIFVHEFGDTWAHQGWTIGDVFNPAGNSVGCFPDHRRAGDLIESLAFDENGASSGSVFRDLVELSGPYSVVGRAVAVHQDAANCNMAAEDPVILAQGVFGTANLGEGRENSASGSEVVVDQVLIANMHGTDGYEGVRGTVSFVTHQDGVMQVYVDIEQVPYENQWHGIHIHEIGDDTSIDGEATGGHYNPSGTQHGIPFTDEEYHIGDIGNFKSMDQPGDGFAGTVRGYLELPSRQDWMSLAGLAVVMHAGEDQGSSEQPAGDSGRRAVVGVIGLASRPFPQARPVPPVLFHLEFIPITCGVILLGLLMKCYKDQRPQNSQKSKVKGQYAKTTDVSDAEKGTYMPPMKLVN